MDICNNETKNKQNKNKDVTSPGSRFYLIKVRLNSSPIISLINVSIPVVHLFDHYHIPRGTIQEPSLSMGIRSSQLHFFTPRDIRFPTNYRQRKSFSHLGFVPQVHTYPPPLTPLVHYLQGRSNGGSTDQRTAMEGDPFGLTFCLLILGNLRQMCSFVVYIPRTRTPLSAVDVTTPPRPLRLPSISCAHEIIELSFPLIIRLQVYFLSYVIVIFRKRCRGPYIKVYLGRFVCFYSRRTELNSCTTLERKIVLQ